MSFVARPGWILLATLLASCAGPERAKPANTAAAVREVLAAQVAAWNAGSIDDFMDTYWRSDELRFASGGQVTRGWEPTRARYKRRYADRAAMGQLDFEILAVETLGPDAAMGFGRWRLRRGAEVLEGLFTVILRRREGRWVIVHDHTSSAE